NSAHDTDGCVVGIAVTIVLRGVCRGGHQASPRPQIHRPFFRTRRRPLVFMPPESSLLQVHGRWRLILPHENCDGRFLKHASVDALQKLIEPFQIFAPAVDSRSGESIFWPVVSPWPDQRALWNFQVGERAELRGLIPVVPAFDNKNSALDAIIFGT